MSGTGRDCPSGGALEGPAPHGESVPASWVDPELLAALGGFPDFDELGLDTLLHFRALVEGEAARDGVAGVSVRRVQITPLVSGLLYVFHAPGRAPCDRAKGTPAMLNIHGGGFVMGSAARDDLLMQTICRDYGMVILSLDYRLAPEAIFPAPLDDCAAGFDWLVDRAEELGLDRNCIGIRGVSAGGGLAAGLALRLRDSARGDAAWLWLLYPMLDDRAVPSPNTKTHVWTPRANAFGWASYLGAAPGTPGVSAYAAPARAETLAGLPPTFLAVGSIDLFAPEIIEFARRLLADGGQVELHVYPGAYHGFTTVTDARVAARYQSDARSAMERFLSAGIGLSYGR